MSGAHHAVGSLACGTCGYATFNSFTTALEDAARSSLVTYADPIVGVGAMWAGWWLLRKTDSTAVRRRLGFALVFAQLPLQRMTVPLLHMRGDVYASSHFFGRGPIAMWAGVVVIWTACVPPLAGAYRAIANSHKAWWFLFYVALFPYLLWGPALGALEYLLTARLAVAGAPIGIGFLFALNEVATFAAFWVVTRWLAAPARQAEA